MFIDNRSDYTGFSNEARASIQMTHSANGPKVSLEEAQRIERETASHLLKTHKLSLIVDLDQTIVHATVDPTVGDWIAEGESWEARQANKGQSSRDKDKEGESDSDDSSQDEEDDEVNPNWEALKDVKKFRLGPESFGLPPGPNKHQAKGKEKAVEMQGCLYYVKPRYVLPSRFVLALTFMVLKSRMSCLPQQCGNQV
jgi:RNA polymerase II subunit A C-terminal domain phosphatase